MLDCGLERISSVIQGADVCVRAACPADSVMTGFSCQVTRGHATGFFVADSNGYPSDSAALAQVICTARSTNDYKQAHIWAAAACLKC
jgi:hypothetical protein